MNAHIVWFKDISIQDVARVGGKAASLGEMYVGLHEKGIRVPNGFAITVEAYRYFIRCNGLEKTLKVILDGIDTHDLEDLRKRGEEARKSIMNAEFPLDLKLSIIDAYRGLNKNRENASMDVAVRSSATTEDLATASFAGQQESYLNVRNEEALILSCQKCFASLFTDRALSYRAETGFDTQDLALAIAVQEMVRSDLASSGVAFSIDTETGFDKLVLINASYGLGENIVKGIVTPDEFVVFKTTLKKGFRPILQKKIGSKETKLIYSDQIGETTKNVAVPDSDRKHFSLSDEEILHLSRWVCEIEDHYSKKHGKATPMDVEWAKDGLSGELFILQARPETVQSQKKLNQIETYNLTKKGKILTQGNAIGQKIVTGLVRVIKNTKELGQLKKGEILVTERTDPDWEPAMKLASAIITNRGGRTCHAAIISRELGVAAVVGTVNGMEILQTGQEVTVSCAEGEVGYVYEGNLPFDITRYDLSELKRPKTKMMLNVGNPDEAFRFSFFPNDGVGLARLEFIISNTIKVHPLAALNYTQIQDPSVKDAIDKISISYTDKAQYFVDTLAQGVAKIGAAFYPNDVIVRLSDFKSNEYADLLGGRAYEPTEENPMLGFRGASRYYDARYRDGFALECQAMQKVRVEMGLTNIKLMIPFCRTTSEGRKVIEEMAKHGLIQGKDGLEVYMMCEVPSNVILAEEFFEIFDGFSIGSNDLTQLVLGVDRDSEIITRIFDERNDAVTSMIAKAIQVAKRKKKKIGICGQAPSDYPDFAKFLVREGIDSISLSPDAVLKTMNVVNEAELRF